MRILRYKCFIRLLVLALLACFVDAYGQNMDAESTSIAQGADEAADSLANITNLEELVVKGESYSMQDGKLTIAPSEGAVKSSMFAIDLLGNVGIPGLIYNIETQSVSVNGSTPVILVNGVISNLNRLKTIKASDVLSVQFTRNVPLAYQRYGNTLIDIRIRKILEGGTALISGASDVLLYSQDAQMAFTYNRGPSQWTLSYAYSRRNNNKVHDVSSTSYSSPQLNVDLSTDGESPFRYNTNLPALNYLYNPSRTFMFQAYFILSANNSHFNNKSHVSDSMLGHYDIDGKSRTLELSSVLNLYLQKTFGEADMLQLEMSGTMANTDYNMQRNYTYVAPSAQEEYIYDTRSRRRSLITTAVYSHIFQNKTTFELGYTNTVARTVNRYNTPDEPYRVNQLNNHVYAQLQKGIGNVWITLNTGMQIDYIKEGSLSRNYIHNASSIDLSWTIRRNMWVSFNANYKPIMIEPSQFIDHQQKLSPYRVTSGNPNLRKPQHWSLVADYTVKVGKISVTPQIVYNRNHYLLATSYEYSSEWNAFVEKPVNLSYDNCLIGRLQASAQEIAGMFNFHGSIDYWHSGIRWAGGESMRLNTVSGYVQAQWYYRQWAAGVSYNFAGKRSLGNVVSKSDSYSTLWASWHPNNHWTLSARWTYMFSPRGWTMYKETTAPGYQSIYDRSIRNSANAVFITATYSCQFGDIFRPSSRNRTINNRDKAKTYTSFE